MDIKNRIFLLIIIVFCFHACNSLTVTDSITATENPPLSKVTYYNGIKSIFHSKCAKCHKKGGVAPFELKSYQDIKDHSKMIKYAVNSKYMPPWPANSDYVSFTNDHSLSETEIETIIQWIDEGMEKGNKKDEKPNYYKPHNTVSTETQSIDISMPNKYIHDSKDVDIYIRTQLKNTIKEDIIDVVGFEIVPENKNIVHHVELYAKNRLEREDEKRGREDFIINNDYFIDTTNQNNLVFPEAGFRFYSGWLPGTGIDSYPLGTSKQLSKNDEFGLLVHYAPYPKIETDSTIVRLHYIENTERQVHSNVIETAVMDYDAWKPNKIFIKANKKETFTISMELEQEMSLFAIHPHAHQLATYMKAYATTPNQDTIPLIEIPKWDFDWQFFYRYEKYIHLPAGTIVTFLATYDNTAVNPENPFSPPRDIYSSFKANDEMMILFLVGKEYEEGDEEKKVIYHHIIPKQ